MHVHIVSDEISRKLKVTQEAHGFGITKESTYELVAEKEKYKDIGDDLDTAFVELILKE